MEDNFLSKPYDCEINSILEVEVDNDNVDKLRVLAIDAQIFSLQYLCAVLHSCNYRVTTTSSAAEALQILTANKHGFDVVLLDVDGSNLNGFKLLETIGLEMYLPVIMVTEDGSLENITKGLVYGAVDYIIKPIGVQEIKNTTSHFDTLNKFKESEQSSDYQEASDDQILKPLEHSNASIKVEEHKANIQSDDPSSSSRKKKRLVWTPELNAKFVKAVQILAKSSRVHPKRILDIMNEPGLTRDNIASHLQKYRVSLKKHKAETNQQGFELERVIQSSSNARSTNGIKWEVGDVNGDRLAVPRFNRFQSLEDMNSIFLNQIRGGNTVMSQRMIPYGSSLVPNNQYQSLLCSRLDGPNYQTPDFKYFDYYNYCLEMNIQPHNLGSQPVSGTTSLSPYFHDVGSEPSTPSSAPFYPSPNAFLAPESDVADFKSPYAVSSVPNLFSGGIPNYAGFSMDCTSTGSTVLTRNGETELVPNGTMISPTNSSSQHNLERADEISEMDDNQIKNSLDEGSFDFYSLFNDDYHADLTFII
ncbi:hypothetical protein REPUB_Repub18cG0042500 [Reevesia pubescens]